MISDPDDLVQRNERPLIVASEFGSIDGGHHKVWVIDQMVRALTGDKHADFVGDDGTRGSRSKRNDLRTVWTI